MLASVQEIESIISSPSLTSPLSRKYRASQVAERARVSVMPLLPSLSPCENALTVNFMLENGMSFVWSPSSHMHEGKYSEPSSR
jgi:hypothetical protein